MKKARIESDEEKAFKELASTLPSILSVSKLVNEGGFLNFDQVLYHSFISRVSLKPLLPLFLCFQVFSRVETNEWENRRLILELLLSEKFSDKYEVYQTPHNDIRLREVQKAKNVTWTPIQSSRDTSDNLSQISAGSEW